MVFDARKGDAAWGNDRPQTNNSQGSGVPPASHFKLDASMEKNRAWGEEYINFGHCDI